MNLEELLSACLAVPVGPQHLGTRMEMFSLNLKLSHSSNALSRMHQFKGFIQLFRRQILSHKFINFNLLGHLFGHQLWDTLHTLPFSKGSAFPYVACDQLKRVSGDFFP